MSLSPISNRYSAAVTLMQQLNPSEATKKVSGDTNDIVKIANGLSAAPGSAAKQASGLAFNFTVSQAVKDERVQKSDDPGSIVMAGIGGGEAVERFDSWDALEARIRTDGTMDNKQKNEWLDKADYMKKSSQDISAFKRTNLYLAMKSGEYERAMNESIQAQLAVSASVSEMKVFVSGLLGEKLL